MAWTWKRCLPCSATTRQASRWTPTLMWPPTPSLKRHRPWGISSLVLSDDFRCPIPLGSGKSDIRKQQLMKNKTPRNHLISRSFGKLLQSGYKLAAHCIPIMQKYRQTYFVVADCWTNHKKIRDYPYQHQESIHRMSLGNCFCGL